MNRVSDIDYKFKFKNEVDSLGIVRFYLDKVCGSDDDSMIRFFNAFDTDITDKDIAFIVATDSSNVIRFLSRHSSLSIFKRMMDVIADNALFLSPVRKEHISAVQVDSDTIGSYHYE